MCAELFNLNFDGDEETLDISLMKYMLADKSFVNDDDFDDFDSFDPFEEY